MRFTIRDLLWLTVVALGVGGCFGGSGDTDEIKFYPPGPELKKDDLPNPAAPAPNAPTD